jgi:GDP-L-fucose synthase
MPEVVLWGSGSARREFLNVDDLARIVLGLMLEYESAEIINVGSGTDISIKELAELIADKVGYSGRIVWDRTKPDGMMRKCLDISRMLSLGFKPAISLSDGIAGVISEYRNSRQNEKPSTKEI